MSFDEIELTGNNSWGLVHGTSIGYGRTFGSGYMATREHHLTARLVPIGRSKKRKKIEIQVTRSQEYITWKSWDDIKTTIDELTEGMPEGSWTIELENTERSYDEGTYGELVATCWRTPTQEEADIVRDHIRQQVDEALQRQEEADQKAAADLLARRPDLFPPTFVEP